MSHDDEDQQQQHAEEQEMEAEALTAIFDTHFHATNQYPHTIWTIELYPHVGDDEPNHVACRLIVNVPHDYPTALPSLQVELIQGLADDEHLPLLQTLANDEAQSNEGTPCVFAVCERLREWLVDNNVKGLDDQSMHAQMLRKQQQQQQQQAKQQGERSGRAFESQTVHEEFTEAELEELSVRKKREEGTPCNKENFEKWKVQFEAEMALAREALEQEAMDDFKKAKKIKEEKSTRQTGYQLFAANMNLEALEAAAEHAEADEAEENLDEGVDEDLFQDDVDLEDLDFESDDDEEDDDEDDIDI